MPEFQSKIKPIEWINNYTRMVDQTKFPHTYEYVDIKTGAGMFDAIKNMIVRGAPAIGIAGAQGVALFALQLQQENLSFDIFKNRLLDKCDYLISARPTAVNLAWAVEQQKQIIISASGTEYKSDSFAISDLVEKLKINGKKIELDDIEINKKIGEYGSILVPKGASILTHCNAGALATGGYGTALGVIRSAFANDSDIKVFADETRPRQQGARITTLELVMDNIPVTLITDGMCSYFMKKKMIDMVVVGADRIAANGDTANKIGTYTVAIAAKYHNIPFYVAAPLSTIDLSIKTGDDIIIEERSADEVTTINGERICPQGVNIINPGFDVTPNELITGIITEKGVAKPNYIHSISKLFKG